MTGNYTLKLFIFTRQGLLTQKKSKERDTLLWYYFPFVVLHRKLKQEFENINKYYFCRLDVTPHGPQYGANTPGCI